ncbi:hypothetical protein [Polymorphospora sp. NPDC050346]|uniref:hypothetical protein n=1 Tax=Polymorphospora sp. NPDC050346 TaxID=3155780 RepID=UPI00340C0D47
MKVARRLLRNLAGSLGILGALGIVTVGLPAIDRAIPAIRPVAAGVPYPVGAGVTVVPPPGAMVDVTQTRPSGERGTVLFLIGPVRYAIVVTPFDGDLAAAAARLERKITEVRGYQITGTQLGVSTAAGLHGIQGGYMAPGRGGRYAVFLTGGLSIEVTVAGSHPEFGGLAAAVEASTRSITVVEAA